MSTVTISPKFQVVIPKEIRQTMKLKSGQQVEMLYYDNHIEVVPLKPVKALRGFLKGIQTEVPRERDRV